MYDIANKQYIFKSLDGQTRNTFFKPGVGLCIRTMSNANSWSEPSVIMKDAVSGFSACLDDKDIIHILCQDTEGSITHIPLTGDLWKMHKLNKDIKSKGFCKFPNIICFNKRIYFFYVFEDSEKKVLLYQIHNEQNFISPPKAIDIVKSGKTSPYKLVKHNNTFYLFYNRTDDKWNQIGYRTFNDAKKEWSSFQFLTSSSKTQESKLISVISDVQNNLHACWHKTTPLKYELIYSLKRNMSDEWEEKTLASSPYGFFNASILTIFNKIIVYWFREKSIFHCISEDRGEKWNSPQKYIFYNDKPLHCFEYIENSIDDYSGISANELPGTFVNGYKLGFINDFPQERKELSAEMNDYQPLIVNTLKLLLSGMEDIKNFLEELSQKISDMEQSQKYYDLELNKHNEKTNSIFSDISSVKMEIEHLMDKIGILKAAQIKDQLERIVTFDVKDPIVLPNSNFSDENGENEELEETESKNAFTKKISVMPGAGFAGITPEYLRSLGKK